MYQPPLNRIQFDKKYIGTPNTSVKQPSLQPYQSHQNEFFPSGQANPLKQYVKDDVMNQLRNVKVDDKLKAHIKQNKAGNFVFNEANTYFFRLGGCQVYSDTPYYLISTNEKDGLWAPIDDPARPVIRNVKMPTYVIEIIQSSSKQYLDHAGCFITSGHKWGFLLYLDSLDTFYQGGLSDLWKHLLSTRFMQELLGKFAYFMKDEKDAEPEYDKTLLSTIDDQPIKPEFVPFYDRLFLHQTQEIGWMFNLELNPRIKVVHTISFVPFFDTGFYINPTNPGVLLTENQLPAEKIYLPGGLLSSKVGSGKTISIIGLITIGNQLKQLKGKKKNFFFSREEVKESKEKNSHKGVGDTYDATKQAFNSLSSYLEVPNIDGPSLVIVTKNILHQWFEELKQFAPDLDVHLVSDVTDFEKLKFSKSQISHDVVLTDRETFSAKASHPSLNAVVWRRIVLDEFHELTVELAKAQKQANKSNWIFKFLTNLLRLRTDFTWGITGTPENLNFHSGIDTLFKFLRYDEKYLQINVLSAIKSTFVKNCIRQNVNTVDLPPLRKSTISVEFGQMQQLLYKGKLHSTHGEAAAYELCSCLLPEWRLLNDYERDQYSAAIKKVHEKHQKDLQEIQQLAASNPKDQILQIRLKNLSSEENFYSEMIKVLSQEIFECPLCFENVEKDQVVVTDCLHIVCVTCWNELFKKLMMSNCPMCKQLISDKTVIIHPRYGKNNESKLEKLIQEIFYVPEDEKIILFTQFTILVDRLCDIFSQVGIEYIVLKGVASEINLRLNIFKKVPHIKVLLMSIEQSASGINVTEANHVFFAHPIFGVGSEKAKITYMQCIGRVNRIGQGKPVHAKLFLTANSLEEELAPTFLKDSAQSNLKAG